MLQSLKRNAAKTVLISGIWGFGAVALAQEKRPDITPGNDKQEKETEGDAEPVDPKIVIHKVLPSDTDGRIDTYSGEGLEHYAYYNASVAARNQLIVFLPGTGHKGSDAEKFNNAAANEGFHLISLEYPDNLSISKFHDSNDPDSFAKAREDVITGKGAMGKLHVNEANSIENRLLMLLKYLSKHFPQEHWDQYLEENKSVIWEKTILSGSSQGGGHAAFMAMKYHKVARVIMFASPKDFSVHFNKPAKWYSDPSETPLNRFFSFVHSADEGHGCTYAQQLENYRAMKLMPLYKVIDVDQAAPPYDHSRLLTSSRQTKRPHASVHFESAYRVVWKYLLEEPVQ